MIITIYTDGSIIENPGGAGGWASVHVSGEGDDVRHRITSGSEYGTTNNRMEMQAAIEGIRAHPIRHQIRLISDSEYLVKGFTEGRVEKWASKDFRKKGKLIPNADLWENLNDLDLARNTEWVHQAGEHRSADTLTGGEHYAALAHEFALSEARIAHWARGERMEKVAIPDTIRERTELIELLKQAPPPPDPPPYDRFECFSVYQRVGSPGKLLFRGPLYTPVSPSLCEDGSGIRDRGRWECQKAATTMSETDATKEGQRYRDWRIPRYEVLRQGITPSEIKKQTGAAYYQFTEKQLEQLRREAGTNDGILRAIPGGRAGGRIKGSLATG